MIMAESEEHLPLQVLEAYHDDELDELQRDRIEQHLRHCAACAGELERLRAASAPMRRFRSARLTDAQRAGLHDAIDRAADDARVIRTGATLAVIAASVLIVGMAWLRLLTSASTGRVGTSASSTTAPERAWESVAVTLRPDPLLIPSGAQATEGLTANADLADWMLDELKTEKRTER